MGVSSPTDRGAVSAMGGFCGVRHGPGILAGAKLGSWQDIAIDREKWKLVIKKIKTRARTKDHK